MGKNKKWYRLILTREGDFITTLRIPTFDRIPIDYKYMEIMDYEGVPVCGYMLYLSREEALIFKTTYKNYILAFDAVKDQK